MTGELKVYIGYDSREDIAFEVCRNSILERTSKVLDIFPIKQGNLRELGLYARPPEVGSATEFSLTRFLAPFLADHDGWTIFVDCDFVFTVDIRLMLEEVRPEKGLYVVQHNYVPKYEFKMDGVRQTIYPRKNWSSLMLFNGANESVRSLTPRMINAVTAEYLHRFHWIDDDEIGELPLSWNYLVGEYAVPGSVPRGIHFTNGGPWFDQWQNVMFADLWFQERDLYLSRRGNKG